MENSDAQTSPLSSDLLGTVVRPPSIRVSRSFNLSGRLTPRSSPSFRKSPSVRTPARSESRFIPPLPWHRKLLSRRLFPWLLVIGLWAYIGLLVLSRWGGHDQEGGGSPFADSRWQAEEITGRHVISTLPQHAIRHQFLPSSQFSYSESASDRAMDLRKLVANVENGDKILHSTSDKDHLWPHQKPSLLVESEDKTTHSTSETEQLLVSQKTTPWTFPSFGTVNSTIGTLVGPFDTIEKRILGPILKKRPRSCQSDGAFEAFVRGRSFMLVFHELSMTGSPLAMMELATEILSCGGRVTAVAQSQKGGLLQELMLRGIKVLKNKAAAAFKFAARADLLVAGSAVCSSWIADLLQINTCSSTGKAPEG